MSLKGLKGFYVSEMRRDVVKRRFITAGMICLPLMYGAILSVLMLYRAGAWMVKRNKRGNGFTQEPGKRGISRVNN